MDREIQIQEHHHPFFLGLGCPYLILFAFSASCANRITNDPEYRLDFYDLSGISHPT